MAAKAAAGSEPLNGIHPEPDKKLPGIFYAHERRVLCTNENTPMTRRQTPMTLDASVTAGHPLYCVHRFREQVPGRVRLLRRYLICE